VGQRVYKTPFDNVSIAAVQDILSLKAGAANGIEIHQIDLTAGGVNSPAEIRLRLKRLSAVVTQGTGGTALTPGPADSGDTKAATATVRANDTAQATTTGTTTLLGAWQWNVLLPWQYLPAPEDRDVCQAGEAFVLDAPAAPGAAILVSGTVVWREVP
jgi:hypothetical protein